MLPAWLAERFLLISNKRRFKTSPLRGAKFIWEMGNLFQIRPF
jgi:hypothetical protein